MRKMFNHKARAKPQRKLFHAGLVGKSNAHEGFVGPRKPHRTARRHSRRRR